MACWRFSTWIQSWPCSFSDLTIYPEPDMPWTLDGEKAEGMPCIHVENLHHAITLIL